MNPDRYRSVSLSASIVVAASLAGLLFVAHEAGGGLYQCRTENGTIYTDTPAQLSQCRPLDPQGSTSPLGLVGGHATGSAPASTSAVSQPLPHPVVPPIPDIPTPSPPQPSAPSAETVTPSPCSTEMNPLNPLSGPPCSTAEAPSSSTNPTLTDTNAPLPTSGQP